MWGTLVSELVFTLSNMYTCTMWVVFLFLRFIFPKEYNFVVHSAVQNILYFLTKMSFILYDHD